MRLVLRRRFLRTAVFCLAAAGSAGVLRAAEAVRTATAEPARVLIDEIRNSSTLEENLRVLCDEIGARMAGTPAMKRAVEWAVGAFREAGVDAVRSEPFTLPVTWQEGETRIEVRRPVRFAVEGLSSAWSPATPRGGIEADVLDGGRGSEGHIRELGEKASGTILLVRLAQTETFLDLGVEQRKATTALREAAEVGAAAVVFASTRENRLLYRHINIVDGQLDPIPSAVLSREDALRIGRLLDAGRRVRLLLDLPNRIGGPARDHNVVAEIGGAERPDEVVILGAHLDSWDLGTGCLDNGCNVALVIEAARAIAASGLRPKRTLRFILFSGEEQGLLGSRAYVQQHREDLDSIVAVIVHDMGLGRIQGYSLGGRNDLEEPLRRAMEPIAHRGASSHTAEAFFGSDHFDFLLEGVPTLIAMQDTSRYARTYHSSADTYDKVSVSDVRERAEIATAALFGIADLPERFAPRLSREQLDRLLRQTRLDEQLQFLELWEDWETGRRGRALREKTLPSGTR